MRIKDILDLELKLPSEGGITPTGTLNIDANGNYNVSNYAYASVNTPIPEGEFTIFSNGYYDCSAYEYVDVMVENAPNHDWTQAQSTDSIEFNYGLEGMNFIIIGANLSSGVYLIWHTEGEEEHEFAVWNGGCTFQTIYDTSRLDEGVIALNNGYNFVIDGDYHLYCW